MEPEHLQGVVTATLSLFGAMAVLRLAKRQLLSFRYTAGWMILLSMTALSSVLVPLANPVARALSTTPGVVFSGLAIFILVGICVQLSISISGLQRQVQTLAEEVALSTARMLTPSSEEQKSRD